MSSVRRSVFLFVAITCAYFAQAQTCTVTGVSPIGWTNPGPSCAEGGNAGSKTILVIPAGITLDFNSVADTWTGSMIKVYGILKVSADVTVNSSVDVYNGGKVDLGAKLSLGTTTGCGYTFNVRSGGLADTGNASDRLYICGNYVVKGGGGGCNSCGGTNSGTCAYDGSTPYCSPAAGFSGPIGFTQNGYSGTLPVKMIYFKGYLESDVVKLQWATSMQENFDYFVVQRSMDGVVFDSIGTVKGEGVDLTNIQSMYSFVDANPAMGMNYYRLKAVDKDYSFEYFSIVAISYSGKMKFWVEPNPTDGRVIVLKANFVSTDDDRLVIINSVGSFVGEFPSLNKSDKIEPATPLQQGIYIIKYSTHGVELTTRAVVR